MIIKAWGSKTEQFFHVLRSSFAKLKLAFMSFKVVSNQIPVCFSSSFSLTTSWTNLLKDNPSTLTSTKEKFFKYAIVSLKVNGFSEAVLRDSG